MGTHDFELHNWIYLCIRCIVEFKDKDMMWHFQVKEEGIFVELGQLFMGGTIISILIMGLVAFLNMVWASLKKLQV